MKISLSISISVALSLSGEAHQLANVTFMLYYTLYPYIYHAKIIHIIYIDIRIYVHAFVLIYINIYEYM